MTRKIARFLITAWIAGAALAYADEQRCNGTARECEQQIRQFLGGKRFLGATIRDRSPGLVIEALTRGGPAERAGLQVGDRLITCNNKSLTSATPRDFKQMLAEARESGKLRMIVWRRGRYQIIDAKLEPYTKEQIEKIIAAHLSQSHPSSAGAQR
ncbi:MAG TPA: PDZ domain-containing protein [Thermoanaerobaculia bacterium]|jgi:predicted metalloprotease with PDZ domain